MKYSLYAIFLICLAAFAAFAGTSSDISRIYREGRREMQEISQHNSQEFNDFCNSMVNNMGTVPVGSFGGGFGGITMPQPQPPPALQLVTAINSALVADMAPMNAARFQQATMQLGMQSGGNVAVLAQSLANASAQLGNNPDADSQRMALACGLMSLAFQRVPPLQIAAALSMMARQLDANGVRWHRQGNFGRIINQLAPRRIEDMTPKFA